MNKEIFEKLKGVFRTVFQNQALEVAPEFSAKDVPGWDSLTHMTLINEIETTFKITLTFEEVSAFKNIGDIVSTVSKKTN